MNPHLHLVEWDHYDKLHALDENLFVFINHKRNRVELHAIDFIFVNGKSTLQFVEPMVSLKIISDAWKYSVKNFSIIDMLDEEESREVADESIRMNKQAVAQKKMMYDMIMKNY